MNKRGNTSQAFVLHVSRNLYRIGMLVIFTVLIGNTVFAQRVGGGYINNPGEAGEWIGGSGKLYTIGNKVGIGTPTPFRRLHLWGPDYEYLRITSEGGNEYSATVAGLELQRRLDNGQELLWDIVNQGGFKIRRNTNTLFHLQEEEGQFGTQANKLTLNIWGKHVFSNSNQLYDGALAIRSSNSGEISTMRLDGSKIEGENDLYFNWSSDKGIRMAKEGDVRIGAIFSDPEAKLGVKSDGWQLSLINAAKTWKIGVSDDSWLVGEGKLVFSNTGSSNDATMVMTPAGNIGIGKTSPNRTLDVDGSVRAKTLEITGGDSEALPSLSVNGKTSTKVLQITGGADLAEPFEMTNEHSIQPGMVVAIDPTRAGQLKISERAYDKTVAGIVSGAGDIEPGMVMGQEGSIAHGKYPVALTGRVYCQVDASYGAIQPGDLLTTSNTPGYAMKVSDHNQAQGAIIGKAMTSLEEGQGLVLVLVSLQ